MRIPFVFLFTVLVCIKAFAQLQPLRGCIVSNANVEGIHILNKTALKYTVTDTDGCFEILAKLNDTLIVSSIVHKIKTQVVTLALLKGANITIYLEERITELDEVIVGKILTGNLSSDISNTDIEAPINFYDLGIPGNTGRQKTLSERKLIEATTGGSGIVPLSLVVNAISGRTKRLKKHLQLERNVQCVEHLKTEYTRTLFDATTSEEERTRFFSFILDSEDLQGVCEDTNALAKVSFLKAQLKQFERVEEAHGKTP